MGECRTQRLRQPIGVYSAQYFLFVFVVIVQHVYALKQPGRSLVFQFFGRIHQVVVGQVRNRNSHIAAVTQRQCTRFRFLGFKNQHSVRGSRTVKGSTGSIFQNGNGFYALRVQVDNALQGRLETVQNEQRHVRTVGIVSHQHLEICIGTGSSLAQLDVSAQTEFRQCVRVGTCRIVFHDAETRVEKLERLQQVVRIQFLQLIAFDSDITAGKTGHFTGRHTCYHNIFHFNRHGCQFYHDICHISFTGNVDFFFLIPDKTNNQCCSATFHNFQMEMAVHVGHSPHTSLFLQYNTGSKQRLACFGIFYHTADFLYVMGRQLFPGA